MAGTEAEHLTGALERLRATFRWKADGLDAAGLQTRVGASSLSLGGLLKHLAIIEDYMSITKLTRRAPGRALGCPRLGRSDAEWEFTTAAGDTPEQLYGLWDDAVERSRGRLSAALADGGLASSSTPPGPTDPCQPAAVGVRPDRGVRAAYRARRPAQGSGGRRGR